MEMTDAKVVEKKIYEEEKKEYASNGLAGTALGIGIDGLALALLNGNGRCVFGSLGGGNMPENVNINAYGGNASSNQPTALQVMEKECADEVKPYYNDYALYIAMNQVISDHGDTIVAIKGKKSLSDISEDELVEYAYRLAIDLLKDKDGVYDIREYFLKLIYSLNHS